MKGEYHPFRWVVPCKRYVFQGATLSEVLRGQCYLTPQRVARREGKRPKGDTNVNIRENKHLVKHLRKLAREHGFRDVLRALAAVAGGKRGAQWAFLSYELRDRAHDEVPE